jgi:hypothetical protein
MRVRRVPGMPRELPSLVALRARGPVWLYEPRDGLVRFFPGAPEDVGATDLEDLARVHGGGGGTSVAFWAHRSNVDLATPVAGATLTLRHLASGQIHRAVVRWFLFYRRLNTGVAVLRILPPT